MPHGQRDWSNIGADEVVHGLADMAELAARLGSVVTYNREGSVLFATDFSDAAAQLELSPYGTGAGMIISAEESVVGPYSLRVATSAVIDQVSTAALSVPIPDLATRIGMMAAILWRNDEVGWQLEVGAYIDSYVATGTLRYRADLNRLDVRSTGGAFYLLDGGLVLYPHTAQWHRAKLVVDLASRSYVRAMVNHREYAVAVPMQVQATTEPNRVDVRLQAFSRDGVARVVYFDDLVVTHGEPA